MINLLPIIIVLLLLAGFLRVGFVFHALYILLGLYIVTSLWMRAAAARLKATRQYESRAIFGDEIKVSLTVENASFLPIPYLRLYDPLPISLSSPPRFLRVVSLLAGERLEMSYILHCRQRGLYTVGPLVGNLGDVFGLTDQQRTLAPADFLVVFPKVLPIEEIGLNSRNPFGSLKTPQILYEDPARFSGTRDYRSGDSPRLVNWRATASVGRLQVRQLEPAMTLRAMIFLNLTPADYGLGELSYGSELSVTVAASIATYLVRLRQEVGLITTGSDPFVSSSAVRICGLSARRGEGQLQSIFELLGRVELRRKGDSSTLLSDGQSLIDTGATVIWVTGIQSESLWSDLLTLKRRGNHVMVIFCGYPSTSLYNEARGRGETIGVECHRVWREGDLALLGQGHLAVGSASSSPNGAQVLVHPGAGGQRQ